MAIEVQRCTMKIICKLRGWKAPGRAVAKDLIKICFKNRLVPAYLTTQYSSLEKLLSSGVPTVRSEEAAHGQGAGPIRLCGRGESRLHILP